jgi:hypothetical protein
MGTDPLQDKLITIQYRRNEENHIYKIWDYNSEKELIISFLNDWERIPRHLLRGGDYFVTFNFRLDGPFLLARCLLNGIGDDPKWQKSLWNTLIHGPDFIDVDQLLGNRLVSFEEWRTKFGLQPSRFKNSEIPHMYKQHLYKEIVEYVDQELVDLEKIYLVLCKEPFYGELEKLRRR